MKILLTGASGLLGRALYRRLKADGFEVLGTAYSRVSGGLQRLNILDAESVRKTVNDFGPDLVIHSAAERRPDVVKSDPAAAEKLNVGATETVAAAAAKAGASILYMSTNYVFDGRNPPFRPDSKVNPLNDYGRMKLAGERIVAAECPGAIILRIPILYGSVEYLGESAVTIIAEGIYPDKPCRFDNRMLRYPTHADDISGVISGLAGLQESGKTVGGIYHWSSAKAYTKYQIARIMAEIMGINPELVMEAEPDTNAAPRPENARLDASALEEMGLGSNRDLAPALREILSSVSG